MTDPDGFRRRDLADPPGSDALETPLASVLILTKNGGAAFEDTLRAVTNQSTSFPYDVLVVDSGSTDGTKEMARRYGVAVHAVEPGEFHHGHTRNLAAALCRGELLVFLTQDAIRFDDTGENVNASPALIQVQNGRPVVVGPARFAEAKPVFPVPKWKG